MWQLMLKGKIDSLTYLNPMPAFMIILTSWIPAMLVLGMSGNDDTKIGLWGLPAFIIWLFILKKPIDLWRLRIYNAAKLTPEKQEELARRTALAGYLASGGP